MDGNRPRVYPTLERMNRRQLRTVMQIINGFTIMVLSFLFTFTASRAAHWHMGTTLIRSLSALPSAPWKPVFFSFLGYLLLLFCGWLQTSHLLGQKTCLITVAAELASCLMIIFSLHLSYCGVLLIVVVDIMESAFHSRMRVVTLCAVSILFVLCSMSSLRQALEIIPLENYLAYYTSTTAAVFESFLKLLDLTNIVGCVAYLSMMLSQEAKEVLRVNQLNYELKMVNQQLKNYAEEIQQMTKTQERNRLAREIHDTLGHALTGIVSAADACLLMFDSYPEGVKSLLSEIGASARQGMTDVRRSVRALRPDALERQNLNNALFNMAEHIILTTNVQVTIDITNQERVYSVDEEDVIYRIVQEGITNAIRHGHARHIRVTLNQTDEGRLIITVLDDGIGAAGQVEENFGLKHMRERLAMLNGTLYYESNGGFLLRAEIPVRKGEKET